MRWTKDCERDKNRKVDGGEEEKKKDNSGKKRGWQKKDFLEKMVLGAIDP